VYTVHFVFVLLNSYSLSPAERGRAEEITLVTYCHGVSGAAVVGVTGAAYGISRTHPR